MTGGLLHSLPARDDEVGRRTRRALAAAERAGGYEVLVGHRTVAGLELSDLSLRTQYLHLTDRLIATILDQRPDTVLFLDKSARPVAWLVAALWPIAALEQPTAGAPMVPRPPFTFLNIDREQWRDTMDPDGSGGFDVRHVPEAAIVGLRRCFLSGGSSGSGMPGSGADLDEPAVWAAQTFLSGRRVLVVDEVAVSGDTLRIAASLIRRAFPDAEVSTAHWMSPRLVTANSNRFNNQVPVWYREETAFGRLVGDRDPVRAQAAASWRTRSGAWFLSLRHPVRDDDGIQLRRECTQLVGDVLRGDLPLISSFDRPDLDAWTAALTGSTPAELRAWREDHQVHLAP